MTTSSFSVSSLFGAGSSVVALGDRQIAFTFGEQWREESLKKGWFSSAVVVSEEAVFAASLRGLKGSFAKAKKGYDVVLHRFGRIDEKRSKKLRLCSIAASSDVRVTMARVAADVVCVGVATELFVVSAKNFAVLSSFSFPASVSSVHWQQSIGHVGLSNGLLCQVSLERDGVIASLETSSKSVTAICCVDKVVCSSDASGKLCFWKDGALFGFIDLGQRVTDFFVCNGCVVGVCPCGLVVFCLPEQSREKIVWNKLGLGFGVAGIDCESTLQNVLFMDKQGELGIWDGAVSLNRRSLSSTPISRLGLFFFFFFYFPFFNRLSQCHFHFVWCDHGSCSNWLYCYKSFQGRSAYQKRLVVECMFDGSESMERETDSKALYGSRFQSFASRYDCDSSELVSNHVDQCVCQRRN